MKEYSKQGEGSWYLLYVCVKHTEKRQIMTANYLLIIVSFICRWKYHCPDRQRNGYSEEKESWNIYIYLYKKTRRSGASLQCTGTLFLSKNYHNSCNYWHCVIPKCRVPPKQLIVKSSTKVEDLRLFCIIMNINANPGRKEENLS